MNTRLNLKNIHEWPLFQKALIMAIIMMLIIYLGYFFDFSVLIRQITAGKQQENELKQQITLIFKNQAELKQIILQQNELEKILNNWQKKLTEESGIPEALNEILKIGSANGLRFNLFNPEKGEQEKHYIRISINTEVSGSYHQIAQFVAQVAAMKPIVSVDNIIIYTPIGTNTDNKTHLLMAKMILKIYYFNGNSDAKKDNK